VALVHERASRTNAKPASRDDTLLVPRIDFDLTRSFSEIEGRHLVSTNVNAANDLYLLSAVQSTRFAMNERGVELRSEAHMAFGCAKQEIPTPEHRLVFDKPFLILLERANAKMPYFALWVDNAELLVRR
jgi:serine protease inhibitor